MHLVLLQGDAYDAFISVAQKSEDAVFVETTKKDVAKAAGLSSTGVAVITNFEGEYSGVVEGRRTVCCCLLWVITHRLTTHYGFCV